MTEQDAGKIVLSEKPQEIIDSTVLKADEKVSKPLQDLPKFVTIMIHKARDLEKKGMLGKADPYVKITVGDKVERSKTVKNNHSPEWQFASKFDIGNFKSEEIKIELFGEDIGKDDKLGHKIFKIQDMTKYENLKNTWIPLDDCKSGEILVSFDLVDDLSTKTTLPKDISSAKTSSQITEAAKAVEDISSKDISVVTTKQVGDSSVAEIKTVKTFTISKAPLPENANDLSVTVQDEKVSMVHKDYGHTLAIAKARNIEKRGLMGKPDPYVKITYGKEILKTKTVNNTYEPEWSYTTKLNVTEQNPEYVILELFDDNIGKDDKLGNTSLNIKDLIKKQSVRDQWIALDNCKSGEILISYEILPRKTVDPSIALKNY